MSLLGQKVLVVGGSSGIGLATSRMLAEAGAVVQIAGRSQERINAALAEIGGKATGVSVDFTSDEQVAEVLSTYNDGSIDHLVISASEAVHGPFADTAIEDIERMFRSKFFGPYRVVKHAIPKLAIGSSVTLFSGALSRRPSASAAGLAAVNGAVESLSRALAHELGPEIRVNCISPGMTRTPAYSGMPEETRESMFASAAQSLPLKRIGTPENIARAVVMLIENDFITGTTIDVDGGRMVS